MLFCVTFQNPEPMPDWIRNQRYLKISSPSWGVLIYLTFTLRKGTIYRGQLHSQDFVHQWMWRVVNFACQTFISFHSIVSLCYALLTVRWIPQGFGGTAAFWKRTARIAAWFKMVQWQVFQLPEKLYSILFSSDSSQMMFDSECIWTFNAFDSFSICSWRTTGMPSVTINLGLWANARALSSIVSTKGFQPRRREIQYILLATLICIAFGIFLVLLKTLWPWGLFLRISKIHIRVYYDNINKMERHVSKDKFAILKNIISYRLRGVAKREIGRALVWNIVIVDIYLCVIVFKPQSAKVANKRRSQLHLATLSGLQNWVRSEPNEIQENRTEIRWDVKWGVENIKGYDDADQDGSENSIE